MKRPDRILAHYQSSHRIVGFSFDQSALQSDRGSRFEWHEAVDLVGFDRPALV